MTWTPQLHPIAAVFISHPLEELPVFEDAVTPPVPQDVIVAVPQGGIGGSLPSKISSLSRTRDLPGMKHLIEQDDERIILATVEAFLRRMQ